MFYESNCHRCEATCFCRRTYCIYIDISLLKTKKHKHKKYIFCLSSWGWLTSNEQVLWNFFCSLEQVCFSSPSLSESASIFLILTNFFFRGLMANFDIHIFIIARENSCKIDRAPYGFRLISYNAGRAPYDVVRCPARHRPMFSYTLYYVWP